MPMIALLADENFNGNIIRGLLRRQPALNIVRVQDVGLSGADDPVLLEWASNHGLIIVTHDVQTMTRYAYDRVAQGKPMPGVAEVPNNLPVSQAIDELLLFVGASIPGEWEGQVVYLPL